MLVADRAVILLIGLPRRLTKELGQQDTALFGMVCTLCTISQATLTWYTSQARRSQLQTVLRTPSAAQTVYAALSKVVGAAVYKHSARAV